jgi:hypothetical protein
MLAISSDTESKFSGALCMENYWIFAVQYSKLATIKTKKLFPAKPAFAHHRATTSNSIIWVAHHRQPRSCTGRPVVMTSRYLHGPRIYVTASSAQGGFSCISRTHRLIRSDLCISHWSVCVLLLCNSARNDYTHQSSTSQHLPQTPWRSLILQPSCRISTAHFSPRSE